MNAVTAAPAGLAVMVTAASLGAAAETTTTLTILKLMAATKLKTGAFGAIILAGMMTPLLIEHSAQAKLRVQNEALRQRAGQIAQLQAENQGLLNRSTPSPDPRTAPSQDLRELLRLRGEAGGLEAAVREMTSLKTNAPFSREEALASMRQTYMDRVNRLKELFAEHPSEAVPELKYMTDTKWLEIAGSHSQDQFDSETGNKRLMASARNLAQIDFALSEFSKALQQYAKDNDGHFPADLSELEPYFKSPVDDSILQRWEILPMSSLPDTIRVDGDWAITQKEPINPGMDQRVAIGMNGTHLGRDSNDWVSIP
jgi:hypothetical protein